MSFTKATAGRMALRLTYFAENPETGEAITDGQGNRIEHSCVFFTRRRSNIDAKAAALDGALGDSDILEELTSITVAPPVGFTDFPLTETEWRARNPGQEPADGQQFAPDDSPLAERFKAYFGDPDLYPFVDNALVLHHRRVKPAELSFRV